jgi:hypothetical protein
MEENLDGCGLDFEAEAIENEEAESLLVPLGEEIDG